MKKLYVGILLTAFFCSADAMEKGLSARLAFLLEEFALAEQLKEMKKKLETAIEQKGDVRRMGRDIIIHLRNWAALTPGEEGVDNADAVLTINEDLEDAQDCLDQNDYEKFRRWITNAENVIISLERQQEREIRGKMRERAPGKRAERKPRRVKIRY